jgi:hypothetical protein
MALNIMNLFEFVSRNEFKLPKSEISKINDLFLRLLNSKNISEVEKIMDELIYLIEGFLPRPRLHRSRSVNSNRHVVEFDQLSDL